ncbi:ABC transporter permease [Aeoliella mucimassa]|uniref:ABC-2 family transporter protein n=1 Tax=Aeoliella mucimassa TaxID=2527972 RepID=A0A518AQX6_9BACT|nr:hypothetical protein [Aeoliella mucimassa]QDU57131.1 ABC-2 family transporter protein [Aeoliella mucimassa]
MSDVAVVEPTAEPASTRYEKWRQHFEKFEAWLSKASDYLNPILVKETRQALKSRQFGLAFVLLLIVCWLITIFAMTTAGPGVYYSAVGRSLLMWYYIVLIFPMIVMVPFAAFRSLSGEREENTYDLLRVSTLSPHQIVRGKLASAIVQDGVYLSAVAPCIAFTYLLRGIDVLTIGLLLVTVTLASIGLSMIGLFLAALSKRKQGQILLSVLFVAALLLSLMGAISGSVEFISGGESLSGEEAWIVLSCSFTFYATTFLMLYLATVALTAYSSDNRSTPLRWSMVLQQAAFVGWIAYFWIEDGYTRLAIPSLIIISTIYWYCMGTMLTTETAELSHRVRRKLPQSGMGRMMFGLFNPGPGTGYFFAVANLTAVVWLAFLAMGWISYSGVGPNRGFSLDELTALVLIYWGLMVFYLGIGKLVVRVVARFTEVTTVAGFLIHVLVILAGSGIPFALQSSLRNWRNMGYNFMQWLNPLWTMAEYGDGVRVDESVMLHVMVVSCLALCVMWINLPGAAKELMQGRVALPTRVVQDEAELHPVEIKPQSPWDEEPTTAE